LLRMALAPAEVSLPLHVPEAAAVAESLPTPAGGPAEGAGAPPWPDSANLHHQQEQLETPARRLPLERKRETNAEDLPSAVSQC
jgi:hypothetical protein